MAKEPQITLQLTIEDPVPGVAYSLQNQKSEPVEAVFAVDGPLSFRVPIRVAPGPRFLGDFVRREGPERRFVYIAIGLQAGDPKSAWSRRAKIDIHTIPTEVLDAGLAGHTLQARLPGRDKQGGPSCATLRPVGGWRVAD
jgi:hypothetical protein